MNRRPSCLSLEALLLCCAVPFVVAPVYAQTYPTKAVRIVVPFPPGSGVDVVARLYIPKLTEILAQ